MFSNKILFFPRGIRIVQKKKKKTRRRMGHSPVFEQLWQLRSLKVTIQNKISWYDACRKNYTRQRISRDHNYTLR